tara:strand:+ start:9182 stop:9409 length:228 start_codon:yes stop_codon:yes gene_type:complete
MNYKLLLYTENEDGGAAWMPFFIDVETIQGFYIPSLDDSEVNSINIMINGEFMTVMHENHIQEYLNERFSKGLKK